jgi:hypothetical protein
MLQFENAKEVGPQILILDNAIQDTERFLDVALNDVKETSEAGVRPANYPEGLVQKHSRSAQIFEMDSNRKGAILLWSLNTKLKALGNEYAKKYNFNFSKMESAQLVWYKKNQDFYLVHSDSSPQTPRVFSFVLYLNDVKEGGETYFDKFDLSVQPQRGRLLMFPSDSSYSHGAKTPISSDKYVAVTWFKP